MTWQPVLVADDPQLLEAACLEYGIRRRRDDRPTWQAELGELPPHLLPAESTGWRWAVYPWRDVAVCLPDAGHLYGVCVSRNYPIITASEQTMLADARVLIAGLSVGRSVAQQLCRLGVRKFTLIDADIVAGSNLNRLIGSGLHDFGESKARSLARELYEHSPDCDIEIQETRLDGPLLDEILTAREHAAVFEVIDSVGTKVELREVASRHGVPVLMPTDMDWEPFVDIDQAGEAPFGGRLSAEELGQMRNGAPDFATKTRLAMQVMGLTEWAPRSMLSGQLAQAGVLSYWSQIAPSAATCGSLATRAFLDVLRTPKEVPQRAALSLRAAMSTSDPVDVSDPLAAAATPSTK